MRLGTSSPKMMVVKVMAITTMAVAVNRRSAFAQPVAGQPHGQRCAEGSFAKNAVEHADGSNTHLHR